MEKYVWEVPEVNSPVPYCRPTNGKRASQLSEGPKVLLENGLIRVLYESDQCHKIHVPVCESSGTEVLCTPCMSKSVVDHIPGAKWHCFANSRHCALLDQQVVFIHVLDQWCAAKVVLLWAYGFVL